MKDHVSNVAYCIFEGIDGSIHFAYDRVVVVEEKEVVLKNRYEVCIDSDVLQIFFHLRTDDVFIFSDLFNNIL